VNLRKTCYRMSDTKVICTECGERGFINNKPKGIETLHCHSCCHYIEIDFSEEKEWYGGHDGKRDIFDCIYCDDYNEYEKSHESLGKVLPATIFNDASDGIHGNRFSIDVKMNKFEYFKALIKTGICLGSLHFRLFMNENPKKAKELLDESLKEGLLIEREV